MKLEKEISINQYGQGLIDDISLLQEFKGLNLSEKRIYLNELTYLILQSKAGFNDIQPAIQISGLKETYTPCVMLSKGIESQNLNKIVSLPEAELQKVLKLFLTLFKIAYKRRYESEKNDPHKWWYWDLAIEENIRTIKSSTHYK